MNLQQSGPRFRLLPAARVALLVLCVILGSSCGPVRTEVDYAFTEPRGANVIEGVPFYEQTANDCGPASMAGVLGYYGDHVGPEEIEEEVGRENLRGTVTIEMILYPRGRGFETEWYEGSIGDIVASVDSGKPLILMVDYGLANIRQNHYLVALGYTPEHIIVNSGGTEHKKTPWAEFLHRWDRTDRWTLRIVPKE